MAAAYATTFAEYVDWMATNAPHATVMDWWRRVDQAVSGYFADHGLRRPRMPAAYPQKIEPQIAADPDLGRPVAELLQRLRRLRNRVEHGEPGAPSREEAVAYAQDALRLIGILTFGGPLGPRPSRSRRAAGR